jgi:hypothetical protein
MSYPSLSLLIAAQHIRTSGHDIFTFEMLYDLFSMQVRTSSAAPVMLGGGGIGMTNVGRRVMMGVRLLSLFIYIFHKTNFRYKGL